MFLLKTTKILGATTLAGALLFTGVGATHSYEAHAAGNYTNVNSNNAIDIAKTIAGDNSQYDNYWTPKDKGDYYEIVQSHKSNVGGSGIIRVYKNGVVKTSWGIDNPYKTKGQYQLDKSSNNTQNSQNTNNNTASQNNEKQEQSNTNDTTAQNNNQGQSSQATSNAKSENKTQSQNQSKALPETGEETSNTTLVTMIASVILAAGSLLAFRRTSKSNK